MIEDDKDYYEYIQYRAMLKQQPENFYLHLPIQVPFTRSFFDTRLQLILALGSRPNYFGMRHVLDPQVQWFSDWAFINHYLYDYKRHKRFKPSLLDKYRFYWLMYQGYLKEQRHFIALLGRKEARTITVAERKFLKIYEEARFQMYIDSSRDEDLAYYRTGLDCDETLEDEQKPLFLNIAYSQPDDPRLAYWIDKLMLTEHIPNTNNWFVKEKAKRLMIYKWKKGQKVDYGDMRVMFNPDTTKIHDMAFLRHCFNKHDGIPENPAEAALYEKLYFLYETELVRLAQSTNYPELAKLNIATPRRPFNPLYVAYKKRWFDVNPVADFEKVFHGVSYAEYLDIVNQQQAHQQTKRRKHTPKKPNPEQLKEIDRFIAALRPPKKKRKKRR